MKLDFGTVLACIIVVTLITGAGLVLSAILFATYGTYIEICVMVGIVCSWGFFIIQYKKGSTKFNLPKY